MKQEIKERIITYKRILNLGNYESKHLEISKSIDADEDLEVAVSRLMEFVERKIREDSEQQITTEIRDAKKLLKRLNKQIAQLQRQLPTPEDDDGIPFDSGEEIPRPTTDIPDNYRGEIPAPQQLFSPDNSLETSISNDYF
ncbi:MAG: hypothetical protein QNJ51_25835 [Calothrix sp. MO_167.B12]|nr:hypothetical protein [Calothrix sp. MO_167.B12]